MGLFNLEDSFTMTSSSTSSATNSSAKSTCPQQQRKKRTFDIAFLTGQNEVKEQPSPVVVHRKSHNHNHNHHQPLRLPPSDNCRSSPPGSSSSSEACSSIDVMTNGSLSESEEPFSPTCTLSSSTSSSPGKKKKTLNSPPSPDILRFESKRTIDIAHNAESVKIKENVQFSSSYPSSTFALYTPWTKLDKSGGGDELTSHGINLSYHHNHHHHLQAHQTPYPSLQAKLRFQQGPGGADPYAAATLAAAAAAMAGSYPYPNILLPPGGGERSHHQPHQQFSPQGHHGGSHQHQSPPSLPPGGGTTLLPPSLTALTLPAQNVCAKCNIGFRMTSDLVYHMRSHHKRDTFDPLKKQREEKLKCPVCHESFRERHHLTRHMTAHQDRIDEKTGGGDVGGVGGIGVVGVGGPSAGPSTSTSGTSTEPLRSLNILST